MNKNSIRNLTLAGAAAFSAMAVVGGTLVHAQSTPTTGTPSATVQQQAPAASTEMTDYLNALAGRLGISADTLKAAIKQTNLDTIAAQLAAGKITQDQATGMTARVESDTNVFPMIGGGHGRGGPGGEPGMRGDGGAALATFLGITQDQLRTEQTSGSSLAEIATAHGKTRDELKAFLTTELNTRLAQEVTDGKITQAQADERLQHELSELDTRIDAKGGPGGPGGHGDGTPPPAPGASSSTGSQRTTN